MLDTHKKTLTHKGIKHDALPFTANFLHNRWAWGSLLAALLICLVLSALAWFALSAFYYVGPDGLTERSRCLWPCIAAVRSALINLGFVP